MENLLKEDFELIKDIIARYLDVMDFRIEKEMKEEKLSSQKNLKNLFDRKDKIELLYKKLN